MTVTATTVTLKGTSGSYITAADYVTILGGAGNFLVTDTGNYASISLGDGRQIVTAAGAHDMILVGNNNTAAATRIAIGSQSQVNAGKGDIVLTASGGGNTVVLGNGNATITALGLSNNIVIGDSLVASASGSAGSSIVTGGNANIATGNGNNAIVAKGDANFITTLDGSQSIAALGTANFVIVGKNAVRSGGFYLGDAINYGSIALQPNQSHGSGDGPGNCAPNGSNTGSGAVLADDIAYLKTLSATLATEAGTNVAITGGATINASSGVLDAQGNYVFKVTSWNLGNKGITIVGDGSHSVVFDIPQGVTPNLNGAITLAGGLTDNQVLFNDRDSGQIGGGQSGGGNNANESMTLLAPYAKLNLDSVKIRGHVFGGVANQDSQSVSNPSVNCDSSPASSAHGASVGNGSTINAGSNAIVVAGDGTNSVFATGGGDSVSVGNGDDTIYFIGSTTSGNNTASLGNGINVVFLSGGNNLVQDGGGVDTIQAGAGNDTFQVNAIGGNVTITGFLATDKLDFSGILAGLHLTPTAAGLASAIAVATRADADFGVDSIATVHGAYGTATIDLAGYNAGGLAGLLSHGNLVLG
jgi:hypothetical protein